MTIIICDAGNFERVAALCRATGCGVELQGYGDPVYKGDQLQAPHWTQPLLSDIGPRSVHAPFPDLCPGSIDPLLRQIARSRFDVACNAASTAGAEHVVFHHGFVPRTSRPAGWIQRSALFWRELLAAHPALPHFHLENMLEFGPEVLADVLDEVGDTRLDACLDIGHAHCNSTNSVITWIEYLRHRIGYVHLHDNHGDDDEHLGLGQGTIPLLEVLHTLRALCPDAIWALEVSPDSVEQSLEWLGEHGYWQAPILKS